MGCSSSKSDSKPVPVNPITVAAPIVPVVPAPVPIASKKTPSPPAPKAQDIITKKDPDYKQIHSAVRWNKDFDEIKSLLNSEAAVNMVDNGNGNAPVHIASQNGHLNVVQLLIERKANLDVVNAKGNTALHMALSYDYYDCAKALLAAGADASVKNAAGHEARRGLDGETSFGLAALLCAETTEDVSTALELCASNASEINKASFVQRGMKTKKKLGSSWTPELQEKFKTILGELPDPQ